MVHPPSTYHSSSSLANGTAAGGSMHDPQVQKQLTEMRLMIEEFRSMFQKIVTDVEQLNNKVNAKIQRSHPV